MKKSIFYLLLASILIVSCKKATEPQVTSFQLEVLDYFTGDSMPNFPFRFSGVSNSNSNFNQLTNDYGRFDTLIVHEDATNFDCKPSSSTDYFIAKSTGQLPGGTNTEVELEVIPYANFAFDFDCNVGNGYIQNVQRTYICPTTAESNVQNIAASQTQYITAPGCGYNMNRAIVFSGKWIVTYEKKPTVSGAWSTYTDTVMVNPGANYIYMIAY